MMKTILLILIFLVVSRQVAALTTDVFPTAQGDLKITFIGHGTLYITWQNKVFHIDPWSQLADYAELPKADVILITHQHRDHLDAKAVAQIRKDDTVVLLTQQCTSAVDGRVVKNGDSLSVAGVAVRVVPAYNVVHKRDSGEPFHPKGEGNGYVLTFADVTIYIAGDTENIPEMAALKGKVDIAFLPVNLPYTMDAAMAADAARTIAPKILYPYHYNDDEVKKLVQLLQGEAMDIRIRNMQ
jgi:L-ascorbate metabolism protein UlaG (beta-lactamase superfamily)